MIAELGHVITAFDHVITAFDHVITAVDHVILLSGNDRRFKGDVMFVEPLYEGGLRKCKAWRINTSNAR